MGQEYKNGSPEDNDYRGAAGCCTQNGVADGVAYDVAHGPPTNPLTSDVVAHVALQQEVYEETGEETSAVESSLNNNAISSAKQIPGHNPPPNETGAKILDQIVKAIRRHIILKPHQAETVALWVVHALGLNAFRVSPRLHLQSPVLGCGKTTFMEVLTGLTLPDNLFASSFTVAAYVRLIDKVTKQKEKGELENRDTTLIVLLDEVDKLIAEDKKTMLGILNSGHTRAGARRIMNKLVGNNYEPESYDTWAATAFASIGPLPTELESRSIVVELQRKRRNEQVSPVSSEDWKGFSKLAELAARWVREYFRELKKFEPACPDSLYNRARDNWLPLLAIADLAGGHWPQTARQAAEALDGELEDPTEGVKLLSDIRRIFDRSEKDRLSTKHILQELARFEERPWGDYGEGFRGRDPRELTDRQLAGLLKPFRIKPREKSNTIRIGAETPRGYMREWFEDAWSRYLSYIPPSAATSATFNDPNDLTDPLSATFDATRSATEDQPPHGPSPRSKKIRLPEELVA
jgi:putative DNA primase/helicase